MTTTNPTVGQDIVPDSARTVTVATWVGPFTTITVDTETGPVVLASGWTDEVDELLPLIAPSLRPSRTRSVPTVERVTDAVLAYHAGALGAIDAVPVLQHSGPFLEHTWEVLRTVDPGAPVTYSQLAALAGRPRAVRAAGSACSRNATALFVPCHRVLPTGGGAGRVGGFRWGGSVKDRLLAHEGFRQGRDGGVAPSPTRGEQVP